MLPKPEKKSKKEKIDTSVEQLDLVDTISDHDKIQKKRNFVIFFLIATVGLSAIFWIYRYINKFIHDPPSFHLALSRPNLPRVNLSSDTPALTLNLTDPVASVISSDRNHWSVYVQKTSSSVYWSSDGKTTPGLVTSEISTLQGLPSQKSSFSSVLPEGVEVKESIKDQPESYSFKTLILLPSSPLFVSITVSGTNLTDSKTLVGPLLEKIYWQTVPLTN